MEINNEILNNVFILSNNMVLFILLRNVAWKIETHEDFLAWKYN